MLVGLERATVDELNALFCNRCRLALQEFMQKASPNDRLEICSECESVLSEMMRRYKQITRH